MAGILDDVLPWIENQESQGNPYAVSPKGATGLMQLMPATAADPGFGITPVRDNSPAENKRVGDSYFTALYNKYGGDVPTSLMAYNWGPGHVDKWIRLGKPQNLVPAETRDYVSKIMKHVMPQNAQTSNVSAKTDMSPQGAPMPSNQADTGTGFDINSLLKQYQGGLGSLGPSLLALGAGIAAGGAPGGGGWGAGLGQGLQGANEIQQQRLHNTLSLAELANAINNQKFNQNLATNQFGLQENVQKEHQGELNTAANLIASAATPYNKSRDVLLKGEWNPLTFASAVTPMRQAIMGAASLTGQDPQKLMATMLPVYNEPQASVASKVQAFEGFMQNLSGEGGVTATNPILAKAAESFKKFGVGPAAETDGTSAPKGGQAVQASAGGSSNAAPAVGEVRKGYKFKGGNPADPASWEKQ